MGQHVEITVWDSDGEWEGCGRRPNGPGFGLGFAGFGEVLTLQWDEVGRWSCSPWAGWERREHSETRWLHSLVWKEYGCDGGGMGPGWLVLGAWEGKDRRRSQVQMLSVFPHLNGMSFYLLLGSCLDTSHTALGSCQINQNDRF